MKHFGVVVVIIAWLSGVAVGLILENAREVDAAPLPRRAGLRSPRVISTLDEAVRAQIRCERNDTCNRDVDHYWSDDIVIPAHEDRVLDVRLSENWWCEITGIPGVSTLMARPER